MYYSIIRRSLLSHSMQQTERKRRKFTLALGKKCCHTVLNNPLAWKVFSGWIFFCANCAAVKLFNIISPFTHSSLPRHNTNTHTKHTHIQPRSHSFILTSKYLLFYCHHCIISKGVASIKFLVFLRCTDCTALYQWISWHSCLIATLKGLVGVQIIFLMIWRKKN